MTTLVDYDFIAETTHLLHLEAPKRCVAIMRDLRCGTSSSGGSTAQGPEWGVA